MNMEYEKDDPLERCSSALEFLSRSSPLQAIIYCRLTAEHIYKRHKTKIWRIILLILCLLYFIYLGVAFRFVVTEGRNCKFGNTQCVLKFCQIDKISIRTCAFACIIMIVFFRLNSDTLLAVCKFNEFFLSSKC